MTRGPSAVLARGSAAGIATLVVERGTALILVAVLARMLSLEEFGRYSFVVAYLTIFQILADLGLESVLLRRLTQEPQERARLLATGLLLRFGLAVSAGGIAVALVPWVAERTDLRLLVAAALPAFLWAAQPICRAFLRAEMRLGEVLAIGASGALATLVLAGAVLTWSASAAGIFLAMGTAQLLSFAIAARRVGWSPRAAGRVDRVTARCLLVESWPVGLNVLVAMAGLRVAPILLMRYRSEVDVGAFASAARLAEALNLLADGALLALFPALARLAASGTEEMRALAAIGARYLTTAFLCLALVFSQIAEPTMSTIFGPRFAYAGPVLAILAWNAVLSALGTLYANLLVIRGRQRVLLALNVVSAVAQIGLQIVLVGRFGLLGAAWGVLGAALVNHGVLALLGETGSEIRPCMRAALWPALVAALVLAVAPLLPVSSTGRAVLLPALLLVAVLLGPFRSDRRVLHRILSSRPG